MFDDNKESQADLNCRKRTANVPLTKVDISC